MLTQGVCPVYEIISTYSATQVFAPLRRPMMVPTSEKFICFGGGDAGAELKEDHLD